MMMNMGSGPMPAMPMSCMCPCMSNPFMQMGPFNSMPTTMGPFNSMSAMGSFTPMPNPQEADMIKLSLTWQQSQIASMRKQATEFLKWLDESEALIEKQFKEMKQAQDSPSAGSKKS
jgi:hypothetical protein